MCLNNCCVALHCTAGCEKQPIIKSDIKTKKHTDPVWQVRWKPDEQSNAQSFLSISSDGAMMEWRLTTNELQVAMRPPPARRTPHAARRRLCRRL